MGTDDPRPFHERRVVAAFLLLLCLFFTSAVTGSLAARALAPGASAAATLGSFMLPLGWLVGWLGVRHMLLAALTLLAPILMPFLLLWLVVKAIRVRAPAPADAAAPAPTWRRDWTVVLIVPACALTCALVGLFCGWQAEASLLAGVTRFGALGAGWGVFVAALHLTGVLPSEESQE